MKPLLSIVIANYNYGRFLEAALTSVLNQKTDQIELIVVDGGSTDNSIEIIRKYASQIVWWISEKDKGQSDAFNKGFSHATGKYLMWLNADDILLPGSLRKVIGKLESHPDAQWFTANAVLCFNDGRIHQAWWGPHVYPNVLQRKNSPVVVFAPSSIFSKCIFEKVGGFDITHKYAMDTALWLKFQSEGVKQRRINRFVWCFRMHENSKTATYGDRDVDVAVEERLAAEVREISQQLGYRMSRTLRLFSLLMRVIDGSFAVRWYLNVVWKNKQKIGGLT